MEKVIANNVYASHKDRRDYVKALGECNAFSVRLIPAILCASLPSFRVSLVP